MAFGAGFHLVFTVGAVLALGSEVAAAPALGAAPGRGGLTMPAAPGRLLARQGPAFRPADVQRRRFAHGHAGFYPGFDDRPAASRLVVILPEDRDEPAREAVPTVIGIARPPAADPVIYRIETVRGRQLARVIRLGADGATGESGGPRIVRVGRR